MRSLGRDPRRFFGIVPRTSASNPRLPAVAARCVWHGQAAVVGQKLEAVSRSTSPQSCCFAGAVLLGRRAFGGRCGASVVTPASAVVLAIGLNFVGTTDRVKALGGPGVDGAVGAAVRVERCGRGNHVGSRAVPPGDSGGTLASWDHGATPSTIGPAGPAAPSPASSGQPGRWTGLVGGANGPNRISGSSTRYEKREDWTDTNEMNQSNTWACRRAAPAAVIVR